MKYLPKMLALSAALLLAACAAPAPERSLSEQLAGKTGAERQEVLENACFKEADWAKEQHKKNMSAWKKRRYHNSNYYIPEVDRLNAICAEMSEVNESK